MPNILTLTVEGPDDLLTAGAYGAASVIRVQSATTETGTFGDITGTGSTPTIALVAATSSYTGYDPSGTASTWYRTRFESSNASRVSDWSTAFQAGDETAGLICSLYDVQQELGTTTATENERILDVIRQLTVAIEGYCDRWFVPRPLSGTTTYRIHTSYGRTLRLPKGIRSITTLAVATTDQPESGGTYTALSTGTYYLDPPEMERSAGWPATRICLVSTSTPFYAASYGVEITGAFGWAAVPYDVQGVAQRATIRRYLGKGGGGAAVAIGPSGTEFLLPDMSGADRKVLDYYKHRMVG